VGGPDKQSGYWTKSGANHGFEGARKKFASEKKARLKEIGIR